jgi:hypothetical protein
MATTLAMDDLFPTAEPLFGRTPDDPDLQAFLMAVGKWPVPPFGDEELIMYLEDKPRGFALVIEDAGTVKHPAAEGLAAQTPLFTACFFFAEGVEGYQAFPGKIPSGIVWSDNASSLVAKLGPPKNDIKNKKTGALQAHRWPAGTLLLTARYLGGGTSLRHVYLGIK